MKVTELIEALQKVDNQDAIVIFTDGEMFEWEIDIEEPLKVTESNDSRKIPVVDLAN
jgi:hypothetical protein